MPEETIPSPIDIAVETIIAQHGEELREAQSYEFPNKLIRFARIAFGAPLEVDLYDLDPETRNNVSQTTALVRDHFTASNRPTRRV
jgi:hypothetical protein